MQCTSGKLRIGALVVGLLGALAVEASGAYDAVVVKGRALNGTSSASVARILSDRYDWKVGVLNLADMGKFDFSGVKLLYFPGAQFLEIRLPDNGRENIRHAVARGMGWIGTCGGSLVAAGRTTGGQNIGLFPGLQKFSGITGNRTFLFDVKHPVVANSRAAERITPELEMHMGGGPSDYILNKLAESGLKKWVVARHKEGKRAPAVVAVLFGKGRVLLITAHPERPEYFPPDIAKAPQVIEMAAEWCAGISDPPGNKPPIVKMSGPASGKPRKTLYFSAVGSEDPEGYPLGYIWDFGYDTPQAMTPLGPHRFPTPGIYTVTLTVTDGKRHTIKQHTVRIEGDVADSAPTVTFLEPFRGNHLSGKVAITVKAFDRDKGGTDGDGIEEVKVELLQKGKVIVARALESAPYTWDVGLGDLPDGQYELKATAVSTTGRADRSSKTIPVVVANKKPLVAASVHSEYVRLAKAVAAGSSEAATRLQAFKKHHFRELIPYMAVAKGETIRAYGHEWEVIDGTWAGDSSQGIVGGSARRERFARVGATLERGEGVALSAICRLVRGRRSQVGLWIAGTGADHENGGYLLGLSDGGLELRRKGEVVQKRSAPVLRTYEDHKLRLQRVGSVVKVSVNDPAKPLMEWTDDEPLTGPEHRSVGFSVSRGMVVITDCKIEAAK